MNDYDDEEDLLDDDDDARMRRPSWEQDEWKEAERKFLASERDAYDSRLDELRKMPAPVGIDLPSAEETAWMTEEERRCVEWFDRHDYDTFMKRSAWYEGEGWIVPYCRLICEEYRLASSEVLDGYANDYIAKCGEDFAYFGLHYPCGTASRSERFLRVADKMLAAANAGNGRAMNALGVLCLKGLKCQRAENDQESGPIIPWDRYVALEWFKRSAEAGCQHGMRNYARCLMTGKGCRWWDKDGQFDRDVMWRDREEALKWYQALSDYGDVQVRYNLACEYAIGNHYKADPVLCARWLRFAAETGHPKAISVLSAAGDDTSEKRIRAELLIALTLKQIKNQRHYRDPYEGVDFAIANSGGVRKPPATEAHGKDWLLKGTPEGTVVPPSASRETVRTPNLLSANPSFAARLIILVRDRFNGDAPCIYRAAHVSRKTYSAIVSNELRPVSKPTAVAFALALRLSLYETCELLKSAGFTLSDFILEDMIVKVCIKTGITDIDEVNEILTAHGAKTFPKSEEAS